LQSKSKQFSKSKTDFPPLNGIQMNQASGPFQNRNALIIGGTSGIGRSTALELAAQGASVIVIGKPDQLSELFDPDIKVVYADMTDHEESYQAISRCFILFENRLDIVVHTVGGSARSMGDGPLMDCSNEGWRAAIQLNLDSAFYSVQTAVRQMKMQSPDIHGQRGAIVVVGSVLADHPSVNFFNTIGYAVAKAGLEALVRNSAAAHAADGIRINMLKPGLVDTPMAKRAIGNSEIAGYLHQKQPLTSGPISPEACAVAILGLADPRAVGLTGSILTLDGGWCLN
jgi:NAD(P)-dependent dehydrogenase (short-subunit alcohol dehydrogenase family)